MLKLVVLIHCDDCNAHFQLSRTSDYTTNALSFNTTALTAALGSYHWTVVDGGKYHFCPDCSYQLDDMDEQG